MPHITLSHKTKPILTIIKSPVFIVFIACLGLMAFNLFCTYRLRPFNSDDVFWQTILLQWHPFNGSTATLGNSSIYVDKIPFYQFFNHFFEPSRKVLFIEAAINALLGFAGFYLACMYFLKKMGAKLSYSTLLPFVWLAGFGYPFMQLYLNSNWRGFQLGISFITFALVAAIWYGDITLKRWWSKGIALLISAYIGLQIYSDPYFVYFTIGPLVIVSLLLLALRKITLQHFASVGLPILASAIFSKVFAAIFYAAGIRTTTEYPMEFIQFDNIGSSFGGSVHSILIIFSSDFFGLQLQNIATLPVLLNFLILCSILTIIVLSLKHFKQSLTRQNLSFTTVWLLFFIGIATLVFASHSISTLGQGTFTYRYFLLLALIFGFILAFTIGTMKDGLKKRLLVGLLIIATLLNLTITAIGHQNALRADVANNKANTLNEVIAGLLISKGYDKGYANYWDASISTYLSKGYVSFLPSVCNDHKAQKWHWLINDNAFDKPTTKSFYFLNPDVPAACQPRDVVKQFGKAQETIPIGNKTMYLYSYDISSRLPPAKQP